MTTTSRTTRFAKGGRRVDPTVAQIAARAARIRATWDDRTEYARRMIRNPAVVFEPWNERDLGMLELEGFAI
ncbi:MAG: hypothetical protein A2W31_04410 [Planctomycetes bacterium RBG_16_64_10]|nr:MAG: hypothetical protein A2W31_04410 [Planctomycetes bacterium RBG_16_64_10]